MASKKTAASTSTAKANAPDARQPRKKRAKDSTSGEHSSLHEGGQALLDGTASSTERPAAAPEAAPTDPHAMQRFHAVQEEVDETLADLPTLPAAKAVQRALLYCDKGEKWLRCYPNMIVGSGRGGTVYVPWQAPQLPAEGVVIDGDRLHRILRIAGDVPITKTATGIAIGFGRARATLSSWAGAAPLGLEVPTSGIAYKQVDPSVFQRALPFTATNDHDRPEYHHVHVTRGCVLATDYHGVFYLGRNFIEDPGFTATLPRTAFVGIDNPCWLGLSESGHAVIADPATNEYRVLVCWGTAFSDIRRLVESAEVRFTVDVPKDELIGVLKRSKVVQTAASSVKLWIWAADDGQWLEMRAGDPDGVAEIVMRLPVRIHYTPQPDAAGFALFKACIAGSSLEKLAALARGDTVRLGFSDARQLVVLRDPSLEAAAVPMAPPL